MNTCACLSHHSSEMLLQWFISERVLGKANNVLENVVADDRCHCYMHKHMYRFQIYFYKIQFMQYLRKIRAYCKNDGCSYNLCCRPQSGVFSSIEELNKWNFGTKTNHISVKKGSSVMFDGGLLTRSGELIFCLLPAKEIEAASG